MMYHQIAVGADNASSTFGRSRFQAEAAFTSCPTRILAVLFILSASLIRLPAQTTGSQTPISNQTYLPASTPYRVVEQEANQNIWQRETYEKGPKGKVTTHIHRYLELASGLNFKDTDGKWSPTREQIDILADGTAAATHGPHQLYFPIDIYNGIVKFVMPDGKQLNSQPLGLSLDDGTNTALIAILTNSVGQLVSSNQIIYPNAFVGVNADIRFTYRRSGIEQDIIIHSQLPAPESLGLNPEKNQVANAY